MDEQEMSDCEEDSTNGSEKFIDDRLRLADESATDWVDRVSRLAYRHAVKRRLADSMSAIGHKGLARPRKLQ